MNERKRRSDEAVAETLLEQSAEIRANIDGSFAGDDPEALHDLRVAVRRTRTVLKGMPGVFAPADHEHYTAEFKELQAITGPVRDYDVLLDELDAFAEERPQLESESAELRKELVRRRNAARIKLRRRLVSKRFADLLDSWDSLLEALPESPADERPDADAPIGELSGDRIARDHARFLELSSASLNSKEPAAVHHARKRGKSLRYNVEFFGALGDKNTAKALRKELKSVQDELGAYQDTVVREAELREAADAAGPGAALAAGAMLERALELRAESLGRFGRRSKRFGGKKKRAAVKRSFKKR